jgi:hypothetical protein
VTTRSSQPSPSTSPTAQPAHAPAAAGHRPLLARGPQLAAPVVQEEPRREAGLALRRAIDRRAVDDHEVERRVAVEVGKRDAAAVDLEDVVLGARAAGGDDRAEELRRALDEHRLRALRRSILEHQHGRCRA